MRSTDYTIGNATQPEGRPAIIVHVCNDVGAWGRGFVLALSRRWPEPERRYRHWAQGATSSHSDLARSSSSESRAASS